MTPNAPIISITIVYFIVLIISAAIDADIWKRKGISREGHMNRAIYRSVFFALNTWILYNGFSVSFWLLQASVWWLFFDIAINWFKGKEIFYVGRTAFLDRIFHFKDHHPVRASYLQLITKIILIIIIIIIL